MAMNPRSSRPRIKQVDPAEYTKDLCGKLCVWMEVPSKSCKQVLLQTLRQVQLMIYVSTIPCLGNQITYYLDTIEDNVIS